MKNINLVNDIGAPAVVTAVNIAVRASSKVIMGMPAADIATYGMAAGGYLSAYMGWGGRYSEFLKNVGIAAAPLAFEKLYNKIKGASVTGRVMTRVSRYPAPASESPFQSTRLV